MFGLRECTNHFTLIKYKYPTSNFTKACKWLSAFKCPTNFILQCIAHSYEVLAHCILLLDATWYTKKSQCSCENLLSRYTYRLSHYCIFSNARVHWGFFSQTSGIVKLLRFGSLVKNSSNGDYKISKIWFLLKIHKKRMTILLFWFNWVSERNIDHFGRFGRKLCASTLSREFEGWKGRRGRFGRCIQQRIRRWHAGVPHTD